jgi:hypothetical protein
MSLLRELASDGEGARGGADKPVVLGVVLVPGDLEISLVAGYSGDESLVVSLDERP